MNIGLILTVAAMLIIIIAALIFTKPVKMYLKAKTTSEDYNTILAIAETGVGWAAQWLWNESNEEKRNKVLEYISDECQKHNIDVSADTMEKALEATYRKIKASGSK